MQEYTIIDRGTWYGVDAWIRDEMQIFVSSPSCGGVGEDACADEVLTVRLAGG